MKYAVLFNSGRLLRQISISSFFTLTILVFGMLAIENPLNAQKYLHQNDVVQKMKDVFKNLKSYQAEFAITSKDNKKTVNSSGVVYFKDGGRINFTFRQPYGDKIISNGKKMWVYIERLRAVGVQDLDLKKGGKGIYTAGTYEGLVSLFERYHVKFDSLEQPRRMEGREYYVLLLNEKVVSGGFQEMLLFVNTQTYLIEKINARTSGGKTVVLELNKIIQNPNIENKYFNFKAEGNIHIVENALTTEQ